MPLEGKFRAMKKRVLGEPETAEPTGEYMEKPVQPWDDPTAEQPASQWENAGTESAASAWGNRRAEPARPSWEGRRPEPSAAPWQERVPERTQPWNPVVQPAADPVQLSALLQSSMKETREEIASLRETADGTQREMAALRETADGTQRGIAALQASADGTQKGMAALQASADGVQKEIAVLQESADGAGSELAALLKRFDGLDATLKEVADRQNRNDRQLAQYIRENQNFQVQVRQGMQEELDGLRNEQKGDHFNSILKEIAELVSAYRPLLLGESDPARHRKNISMMFDQMEDLLDEYGAEVFESRPGSRRETRRSKIIKKIPTGDESKHNTVVRSIRPGVVKGKLVLSEEYIDVYIYDPALEEQEKEAAGSAPEGIAGAGPEVAAGTPEAVPETAPEAAAGTPETEPEAAAGTPECASEVAPETTASASGSVPEAAAGTP